MIELKDWLILSTIKKNLMDEDHSIESKYPPYIINRCMSRVHLDAIMFANEMNINNHLDKRLQYDFYLNTLRSKKRYCP